MNEYELNKTQISKNYQYLMSVFPKGFMKLKIRNNVNEIKQRSLNHFPRYLFTNSNTFQTKSDYYNSKTIVFTNSENLSPRKFLVNTTLTPSLSPKQLKVKKTYDADSTNLNTINEKGVGTNDFSFKTVINHKRSVLNLNDINLNTLPATNSNKFKGSPIKRCHINYNLYLPSLPIRMKNRQRKKTNNNNQSKNITTIYNSISNS